MEKYSLKLGLWYKLFIILLIGISSGLPFALIASTLKVWMTEVGVNKAQIGYVALVATPYSFKFLWSPFIDAIKLPILTNLLGRRRSWLLLSQIMLIISIIMLGASDPVEDLSNMMFWAVSTAFFSATQDIVIDAYRIEMLEQKEQGYGSSMTTIGYRIGILLSSAGALFMSEYFSWDLVYLVCSIIISVGFIATLLYGEPKVSKNYIYKPININILKTNFMDPLLDFMKKPNWKIIILFIIFFKLGDAMAGVMTERFVLDIGFSKAEIATIIKTFGLCATLFGTFLGGVLTYKVGIMRALWISAILQTVTNLLFCLQAYVGYDVTVLAITIGFENMTGGMGAAVFVAYASSLCNISYTATQYAVITSLATFGRNVLASQSGKIADILGWFNFFLFTVLAAMPGIIFLYILQKKMQKSNNKS